MKITKMENTNIKTKRLYLFWYKANEYARTEYVYICATSSKEATRFFKREGLDNFYDYDEYPIEIKRLANGDLPVGTMLWGYGAYASY